MRRVNRYGWKRQLPDHRDHRFALPPPGIVLPPVLDLRPMDVPIFNQLETSSCTGNSTIATMEFVRKAEGLPNIRLSRLFPYWNARVMEGTSLQDDGAEIRDVIKGLAQFGTCPEEMWPFDPANVVKRPEDACYTEAVKDLAIGYSAISQVEYAIRTRLVTSRKPFVFGFTVYESFESDAMSKGGILTLPGSQEGVIGGHAVDCYGYLHEERYFIIRNSWGPDWGLNGYFLMPYDYLLNPDLSSDFWQINVTSNQ